MKRQFRFIEHPKGTWRVEEKGWLTWSTVYFYGDPIRYYRDPAFTPPYLAPPGAFCHFTSLDMAKKTLSSAVDNVEYRRVVYP